MNINRSKLRVIAAGLLVQCAIVGTASAQLQSQGYFDVLDQNSVPDYLSASVDNSVLAMSSDKWQTRGKSLRWDWSGAGAYMQMTLDQDYLSHIKFQSPRELQAWVYSDNPNGGQLLVQWGSQQTIDDGTHHEVTFELNYTGWRALEVRLDEDGQSGALPASNSEFRVIRFKPTSSSGYVFIDTLHIPYTTAINHGHLGSYQQPWLVPNTANRHDYPWYPKWSGFTQTNGLQITPENLQRYDLLNSRLTEIIGDRSFHYTGKTEQGYPNAAILASDLVVIEGDEIVGPMINTHKVEEWFRKHGGLNQPTDQVHMFSIFNMLGKIAKLYHAESDAIAKQAYRDEYFMYLDYFREKGFEDGSSMFNQVFSGKNANNLIGSFLDMRAELEAAGRWDYAREVLEWIAGYDNLYDPDPLTADADKMLGDFSSLISAIHFQPDDTDELKMQKLYDADQFIGIIRKTMSQAPIGSEDRDFTIVAPDFSTYHHDQDYLGGYADEAWEKYFNYTYFFQESLTEDDFDLGNGFLDMWAWYFTPGGYGPQLGQRGISELRVGGFVNKLNYAAASGYESAKKWLKYYYNQDPTIEILFDNYNDVILDPTVVVPETLTGNFTQAYSTTTLHRRDDWMVALRGFGHINDSPEVFGSASNQHGGQQGFGFLQLIGSDGLEASGIYLRQGGWDWRLYPGATTVYDFDASDTPRKEFIEQDMNGGLSHFKQNGMFYQRLAGNVNEPSVGDPFTAEISTIDGHKSYFLFDDTIICLGSGLKCDFKSPSSPMVTTLFQYGGAGHAPVDYIQEGGSEVSIAGNRPESPLIAAGVGANIKDPAGNVYHFPASNDELVFRRGDQTNFTFVSSTKSDSNYYSTAFFNHGAQATSGSGGSYEYAIKVFGGDSALDNFTSNGLYEVLQKDSSAHILKYTPAGTSNVSYGYAFIESTSDNPHGPVVSVSDPVLVMATETDQSVTQLTISNPAPYEPDGILSTSPVSFRTRMNTVVVAGEWDLVHCKTPGIVLNSWTAGGNTHIEVGLYDGKSVDIELVDEKVVADWTFDGDGVTGGTVDSKDGFTDWIANDPSSLTAAGFTLNTYAQNGHAYVDTTSGQLITVRNGETGSQNKCQITLPFGEVLNEGRLEFAASIHSLSGSNMRASYVDLLDASGGLICRLNLTKPWLLKMDVPEDRTLSVSNVTLDSATDFVVDWNDGTLEVTYGDGNDPVSFNCSTQIASLRVTTASLNSMLKVDRLKILGLRELFTSATASLVEGTQDYAYSGSLASYVLGAGTSATFTKIDGPDWITVAADGSFTGTPGNEDVGVNTWTVQVDNGNGQVDTITLQIEVANVNDAPEFSSESISLANANEDAAYSASVTAADIDPGDVLTYTISGPSWLSVSAGGALSGTPAQADVGLNSWTVSVEDSAGSTDSIAVTLTVENVNDAPVIGSSPFIASSAVQNVSFAGALQGFASDEDGDTLIYSKVSGPSWLNISSNGALSGTPSATDVGMNQFTVEVEDPSSEAATGTVQINVIANEAPVVVNDPFQMPNAMYDKAYVANLDGVATDPNASDILSYSKVSGPSWLSILADGSLTGTPGLLDTGVNEWEIEVADDKGATVVATMTIEVLRQTHKRFNWSFDGDGSVGGTVDSADGMTDWISNDWNSLLSAGVSGNTYAANGHAYVDTANGRLVIERADSGSSNVPKAWIDLSQPLNQGRLVFTASSLVTSGSGSWISSYVYLYDDAGNQVCSIYMKKTSVLVLNASGSSQTITSLNLSQPNDFVVDWANGVLKIISGGVSTTFAMLQSNVAKIEFEQLKVGSECRIDNLMVMDTSSFPIIDEAISGTVIDGSLAGNMSDASSDDVYEALTEGLDTSSSTSILERQWAFDVYGEETVTFYVEAYHTANSEGDDFIFAYSTDGQSWTEMLTVADIADDNVADGYALPSNLRGPVYIRVHDADGSPGNTVLDTLYIDSLFIESNVAAP